MIPFDEAQRRIMSKADFIGKEQVPLEQSLYRVLAQEVVSDMDMPPFDKSVMDGYACRRSDLGNELRVVETIAAGRLPRCAIGENECAKIMTGASVPAGADWIAMVEHTEETSPTTIRCIKPGSSANICRRGEDLHAGDRVLACGTRILPAQIAVMATAGCARPWVALRPRVGVLATGSELVEPFDQMVGGKIRNSNGWQLASQVEQTGCVATRYPIVEDTPEALRAAIRKALAENDVLLISGGVSMGDFDFVPEMLRRCGVELIFTKVAIKPGKPSTFGVAGKVCCFALPGNPVATFMQFETLVKPFLFKMMGHSFVPHIVAVPLQADWVQKESDRATIVPVRLTEEFTAELIEYHGSAHINALGAADGLILFQCRETTCRKKGTIVHVRLF